MASFPSSDHDFGRPDRWSILFLSSIVAPSIGRKWCLKDWMEELARILSGNKKQLSNSRAVEVCTLNSRLSAWLELLKTLALR